MFQDFDIPQDGGHAPERVARVRELMAAANVDALVVPLADEHQGEYVPASAQRLKWLTGFTGSAGMAVIGRRKAALLVDGRYTIQARGQVDTGLIEVLLVPAAKLSDWIKSNVPAGGVVGFDPWLHTLTWVETLVKPLDEAGVKLKPLARNLVDRAWGKERPAAPAERVLVHPLKYAGVAADAKIARVQQALKDARQDAVVLTTPDSICWLLNIRGSDVPHNPVVLAFAIVPVSGKPDLFIDPAKLDADARAHLSSLVRLHARADLRLRLEALREKAKRVRLDPDTAAYALARAVGHANVARGRDPSIDMKAAKCAAEIKGARAAHARDGAAMCRFLAWLAAHADKGGIDEIAAVKELERFRRDTGQLRDISFDTISGSGPNGAIVHYRVTTATNRPLKSGELFLIDSGAQYPDGTTDITRTVAVGKPSEEMRQRYTAVLRGHIAISCARFPVGTRGIDLDGLARRPLWELGLDYDHGTGHGVGSYLSVHEGPASISKRGMVELTPGMILSNEPGYYKAGAYGIRIENLVLVSPSAVPAGGERPTMSFETLTLVPYDRRLIALPDLDDAERAWVDAYHARVRDTIGPALDGAERRWLSAATEPLA